jgi:hypothetical protein
MCEYHLFWYCPIYFIILGIEVIILVWRMLVCDVVVLFGNCYYWVWVFVVCFHCMCVLCVVLTLSVFVFLIVDSIS